MICGRVAVAIVVGAALSATPACRRAEKQECRERYATIQTRISQADKTPAGIEGTLEAVRATLAVCRSAGLDAEIAQLSGVEKALSEQLERASRHAARKPKELRTPEELARLEKQGDPSCPKGQAYKHQQSGKEIRCTGPQPIGMGWDAAVAYFESRDFSVKPKDDPSVLALEHGAELLLFIYSKPRDPAPPRCVRIHPPPGSSWQEAVSRATGAPPWTLRKGGTVKTPAGVLAVDVTESEREFVVRLGSC